jgi:hypothetical protein
MDTESSRVFQGSGLILMDGEYELTTQIKSNGLQYMILNVDRFSGQHPPSSTVSDRPALTGLPQKIQYTIFSKLTLIRFE